jgi:hypothetical protein
MEPSLLLLQAPSLSALPPRRPLLPLLLHPLAPAPAPAPAPRPRPRQRAQERRRLPATPPAAAATTATAATAAAAAAAARGAREVLRPLGHLLHRLALVGCLPLLRLPPPPRHQPPPLQPRQRPRPLRHAAAQRFAGGALSQQGALNGGALCALAGQLVGELLAQVGL